jgi:hypothetical protein
LILSFAASRSMSGRPLQWLNFLACLPGSVKFIWTPSGRVTLLPFQCSTWTLDPASIPTCKELWIVEPPSVADDASLPLGKRTLVYPVDILYSVSFFFANYIQFQFTVHSHLLLIPTHRMGWTLEKAPAGPLWVSPSLPFSIKRG